MTALGIIFFFGGFVLGIVAAFALGGAWGVLMGVAAFLVVMGSALCSAAEKQKMANDNKIMRFPK